MVLLGFFVLVYFDIYTNPLLEICIFKRNECIIGSNEYMVKFYVNAPTSIFVHISNCKYFSSVFHSWFIHTIFQFHFLNICIYITVDIFVKEVLIQVRSF